MNDYFFDLIADLDDVLGYPHVFTAAFSGENSDFVRFNNAKVRQAGHVEQRNIQVDVIKGQRLQTVSDTLHFTYSALRKWVYRFANQGAQGLMDRPRSGRPPKVTCALEQHLNRLVDQDPLQHGSVYSQWSCRELATVLAQQTGIQLGRESVRGVLKKRT